MTDTNPKKSLMGLLARRAVVSSRVFCNVSGFVGGGPQKKKKRCFTLLHYLPRQLQLLDLPIKQQGRSKYSRQKKGAKYCNSRDYKKLNPWNLLAVSNWECQKCDTKKYGIKPHGRN